MSIKVITGVPGSGKTFYAVKEVISKNFEWSDKFGEWVNLTDVTIISNIVGLKLPHIRFDAYLRDNQITFRHFFTVNYFKRILIPEYKKVVILLDEAQKLFPYSFRDVKGSEDNPDELSNFHFFEFHRHLSTDIYLIGQLWTRFSTNIVNLSEYQIDAQRRTLSILGEFKYFFRNGFDIYFTKKIKPDKKIFALYKSTETEENEGETIRPIRRMALIVFALLSVSAFAGYNFYSMMLKPNLTDADSVFDTDYVPLASAPFDFKEAAVIGRVAAAAAISGKPQPVLTHDSVSRIKLGGFWLGNRLVGIEFFGNVFPVRDFTYPFIDDYKNKTVIAMVPDDILGQIPRVQTGDYMKKDGNWGLIGSFETENNQNTDSMASIDSRPPPY